MLTQNLLKMNSYNPAGLGKTTEFEWSASRSLLGIVNAFFFKDPEMISPKVLASLRTANSLNNVFYGNDTKFHVPVFERDATVAQSLRRTTPEVDLTAADHLLSILNSEGEIVNDSDVQNVFQKNKNFVNSISSSANVSSNAFAKTVVLDDPKELEDAYLHDQVWTFNEGIRACHSLLPNSKAHRTIHVLSKALQTYAESKEKDSDVKMSAEDYNQIVRFFAVKITMWNGSYVYVVFENVPKLTYIDSSALFTECEKRQPCIIARYFFYSCEWKPVYKDPYTAISFEGFGSPNLVGIVSSGARRPQKKSKDSKREQVVRVMHEVDNNLTYNHFLEVRGKNYNADKGKREVKHITKLLESDSVFALVCRSFNMTAFNKLMSSDDGGKIAWWLTEVGVSFFADALNRKIEGVDKTVSLTEQWWTDFFNDEEFFTRSTESDDSEEENEEEDEEEEEEEEEKEKDHDNDESDSDEESKNKILQEEEILDNFDQDVITRINAVRMKDKKGMWTTVQIDPFKAWDAFEVLESLKDFVYTPSPVYQGTREKGKGIAYWMAFQDRTYSSALISSAPSSRADCEEFSNMDHILNGSLISFATARCEQGNNKRPDKVKLVPFVLASMRLYSSRNVFVTRTWFEVDKENKDAVRVFSLKMPLDGQMTVLETLVRRQQTNYVQQFISETVAAHSIDEFSENAYNSLGEFLGWDEEDERITNSGLKHLKWFGVQVNAWNVDGVSAAVGRDKPGNIWEFLGTGTSDDFIPEHRDWTTIGATDAVDYDDTSDEVSVLNRRGSYKKVEGTVVVLSLKKSSEKSTKKGKKEADE